MASDVLIEQRLSVFPQGLYDPTLSPTESSPNDQNFSRNTHEEHPSLVCWLTQSKSLEFSFFRSLPDSQG